MNTGELPTQFKNTTSLCVPPSPNRNYYTEFYVLFFLMGGGSLAG